MNIQSNVSFRPWPDLPATFESLNDDTLTTVLEFVGNKSYRSFGVINKRCKEVYVTSGMTKETFVFGYAPLSVIQDRYDGASYLYQDEDDDYYDDDYEDDEEESERAEYIWNLYKRVGKGVVLYDRRDVWEWALQERINDLLSGICNVAAQEGRINTLVEVWNNVEDWDEDDKRLIFGCADSGAAGGGKLNVIKWIETKEFDIDKDWCARLAAWHGQLQILEWLREEKDLELDGGLYNDAIQGRGHLNVMQWLREQEVDWNDWTFRDAAQKGNFNVLQWLHDEGCPWPDRSVHDDNRVHEDGLEPEVIDWLRVNGYGDRIVSRR